MLNGGDALSANFILYCRHFDRTRAFYSDVIGLRVLVERDWFVEFELNAGARLSIADAARTTIRAAGGEGLTVTLEVEDADAAHRAVASSVADPEAIRDHPWGGRAFFVRDPDGHRIEIWSR